MHASMFTLVYVFHYTVGSGRGDGAANFAELDSDFSELGKHVWTFDMIGVLHVCLNGCEWHMSIGEYLVACKATIRVFRSYRDLWWEMTWSCGDMKGSKMVLL